MRRDEVRDQDAARRTLGRMIDGLDAAQARALAARNAPAGPPAWLTHLLQPRTLAFVMAGFTALVLLVI